MLRGKKSARGVKQGWVLGRDSAQVSSLEPKVCEQTPEEMLRQV